MKNIEEDNVFGKSDLEKIIKNGKKIIKSLDRNKSISYINEKFRQTFKSKPFNPSPLIQTKESESIHSRNPHPGAKTLNPNQGIQTYWFNPRDGKQGS